MNKKIKEKLALLPDQPGCYLMKDRQDTVIYVGKAKILKTGSRSYFERVPMMPKHSVLSVKLKTSNTLSHPRTSKRSFLK